MIDPGLPDPNDPPSTDPNEILLWVVFSWVAAVGFGFAIWLAEGR